MGGKFLLALLYSFVEDIIHRGVKGTTKLIGMAPYHTVYHRVVTP